jgi:fructose-bisphosphate aldolase class I
MAQELRTIAAALVTRHKGILAADETPSTLTKRFDALGIPSTPESRRAYREMLFSTPGIAAFISGVILQDETIRQSDASGTPLARVLSDQGVMPGIKVDTGAKPLAGWPGELVTEGLDRLRERLAAHRELGARFAKWRAVIRIGDGMPSRACVSANAHALARYAALCQEQQLAPIVEPEVLMAGAHRIERCEEVTGAMLQSVFEALDEQGVAVDGMLLKPNMVTSGQDCPRPAPPAEVAAATLECLTRHVPAAVPGVVFLSGGQDDRLASVHLDAINRLAAPKPWTISFSYGRALQDPALKAWGGREANVAAGQSALLHRASCNSAASVGTYTDEMETTPSEHGRHRATPKSRAKA